VTRDLRRRLARLEAGAAPAGRERYVRLDGGDPVPEPAPGERLTVVRWLRAADAAAAGSASADGHRDDRPDRVVAVEMIADALARPEARKPIIQPSG
jgi:hypothetical protein